MLNVSDEVKTAFKADTVTKTISIRFPNLSLTLTSDQVKADSIKFVEAIESEKYLNFAGCKSSRLEFECLDLDTDIRGEQVIATITAGSTTPIPLFNGYVYSVSNLNHEDISTEVVCYDKMKKITDLDVAEWYNGLSFPRTLKSFRDNFATYCGVSQNKTTLELDSLQITKSIDPDEMSGKDVLVAICQANGVFARIDRNGNLDYTALGTTANAIARSEYSSAEYENFQTASIDKVQIRTDEDDIGAVYGSGSNCYVVENNFLFFDQDSASLSDIAQRIYNKVAGYTYCPITLNLRGLPWLEPGDCITFATKNNTVTSYILSRTLSGLPFIKDVYTAKGAKERSSQVNSVNSQITQLKGRANRLSRTIDETKSQIEDVEAGLSSEITQTKDAIEIEISDLQSQIDGSINVYNRDGEPTLLNYPAWDFTYNIPCDGTVQTTTSLHFLYTSDYYKKNQRSLCYDQTGGQTYRFRKDDEGTYYWEVVQDTEYSVLLSRITSLEVKDGEIESSITETNAVVSGHTSNIQTLQSSVKQMPDQILSTVSETYETISNVSSKISQSADGILEEVSGTYYDKDKVDGKLELKIGTDENDKIVSMLNASADVITLKSNRLEITSDYFKLKKDGTLTATNGTFTGKVTATSGSFKGSITANSGTIGGLTIASDGISKTSSGYKTTWQSDGTLVCYDSSSNVKWALQKDGGAVFNGDVTINGYTTTTQLNAATARISSLEADHVTTAQLNAVSGRVGNLEADHVTTDQLNAVSASINTLSAKAITTDNFSAQSINASQITSGTISASRLSADVITTSNFSAQTITANQVTTALNSPTQGTISVGTVRTATYQYYTGSDYKTLGVTLTINGSTYRLLGYKV